VNICSLIATSWSISTLQVINSNSDTDVVEAFTANATQCKERLKEASRSNAWTKGMDTEMALLHEQGITVAQMEEFLQSLKIERELSDALKLASVDAVDISILSDANTWFIDVILRANGLQGTINRGTKCFVGVCRRCARHRLYARHWLTRIRAPIRQIYANKTRLLMHLQTYVYV
jgi:hypothetical protein